MNKLERDKIMEWFRDDANIESNLHSLSDQDKYEIALLCVSGSDALYRLLEAGIELREGI
jgi:hypothetical protein